MEYLFSFYLLGAMASVLFLAIFAAKNSVEKKAVFPFYLLSFSVVSLLFQEFYQHHFFSSQATILNVVLNGYLLMAIASYMLLCFVDSFSESSSRMKVLKVLLLVNLGILGFFCFSIADLALKKEIQIYTILSIVTPFAICLYRAFRAYKAQVEYEQARYSVVFLVCLLLSSFFITNQLFYPYFPRLWLYLFSPLLLSIFYFFLINKHIIVIERALKDALSAISLSIAYFALYKMLYFVVYYFDLPQPRANHQNFLFVFFIFSFLSFNYLKKIVDGLFLRWGVFRSPINFHLLFRSFSNVILSMTQLEKIYDLTVKIFYDAYAIQTASIFILDEKEEKYRLRHCIGADVNVDSFSRSHPLVKLMKKKVKVIMLNDVVDKNSEIKILKNDLLAEIVMPLDTRKGLYGFVFLGKKKNFSSYSSDDMEVLTVIGGQLSVAINNASFLETERESFELMAQRNKMDAIIALSSGINHEINNPLSIISMKCENYLRKLKMDKFENEEEKLKSANDVIDSALRNATRANMITNRLGNFAKPSRDAGDLELLSLSEAIKEAVELIGEKQLSADGIVVTISCAEDIFVSFDKAHLQQVLFNLIMNAYHAIEKNGVIELKARYDDETHQVIVEVRDDGKGIDSEIIEKIWEPFFTTKPIQPNYDNKFSGTGLGLALVKRYLQHSGGRVEVISEDNKGTTFKLYFNGKKG